MFAPAPMPKPTTDEILRMIARRISKICKFCKEKQIQIRRSVPKEIQINCETVIECRIRDKHRDRDRKLYSLKIIKVSSVKWNFWDLSLLEVHMREDIHKGDRINGEKDYGKFYQNQQHQGMLVDFCGKFWIDSYFKTPERNNWSVEKYLKCLSTARTTSANWSMVGYWNL